MWITARWTIAAALDSVAGVIANQATLLHQAAKGALHQPRCVSLWTTEVMDRADCKLLSSNFGLFSPFSRWTLGPVMSLSHIPTRGIRHQKGVRKPEAEKRSPAVLEMSRTTPTQLPRLSPPASRSHRQNDAALNRNGTRDVLGSQRLRRQGLRGIDLNLRRRFWKQTQPLHRKWQLATWLWTLIAALHCFPCETVRAEDLPIEKLKLPPLRIHGLPAKAHTQGLEQAGGKHYVTARREDVRPKQALLLRTDLAGTNWDVWDITPLNAQGVATELDHPGGMQCDGKRLWIPLAESKRNSHSVIRAFLMQEMTPGRALKPDFEFPVDDHIGAIAVSIERQFLFGANWDTEKVYVWNFKGHLQRTLTAPEIKARGLGMVAGAEGRPGVAVQDWKFSGDRLYASGLFRAPGAATVSPASRLLWFTDFLDRDVQRRTAMLPLQSGTELAREAMAISDGAAYFLPEDLGVSNRLFRVLLTDLAKQSTAR